MAKAPGAQDIKGQAQKSEAAKNGKNEIGTEQKKGQVSCMQKIKAWIRLTRAEHSIMSALGVLVGILIALKTMNVQLCADIFQLSNIVDGGAGHCIPIWQLVAALLVPICINLGAFALNDYFDVEADRQNKKEKRPLVSGELSKNTAIITAIAGLLLGCALGFLISVTAGIIALAFAALSFLYNWKLKDYAVVGNLFIALSMGIAFPFGVIAMNGSGFALFISLILALGSVFAGMGREIVKTVQDMKGDAAARGSKSLPHVIGAKNSLYLAAVFFVLFAVIMPYLVMESSNGGLDGGKSLSGVKTYFIQWNIFSLALLAIAFFAFITMAFICVKKETTDEEIERIRKTSLYALAIALVAIMFVLI
ncbi:MAG: UbiA family prenyltransferase [Candidatus Micrarchaeia archaeon]